MNVDNDSRTMNSIKNVGYTSVIQLISFVVSFFSRTIFILYLGNQYLSISGLFANIMLLLSFTELGIGNAIVYSLYKPIAEKDIEKTSGIINLCSRAYKYIIIATFFLGLCIIPVLDTFIKDVPEIQESIYIIYLLFLFNMLASYLFAYKKLLLIADQKNYIVVVIQQVANIIQTVIQIVFLISTQNYIAFLAIQIFCTLFTNIATTIYVDKKYININKDIELDIGEKKHIFTNMKSIFCYRVGAVLLNGSDNIIIAAVLKTTYVGLCANFFLVINTVNTLLMQACNSIAASIGNHNVDATIERKKVVFEELFLVSYLAFGVSSICLAVLLNPFIAVWVGDEYLLDNIIVLSMVLAFYITGVNQIPSLYRTSMGFFEQAKYVPIIASIFNIILSIILGKCIGLAGIFFATSISKILTFSLIDPIMVYKKGFNKSSIKYFYKYFMFFLILLTNYIITVSIVSLITISGITGFLLKTIISMFLSIAIYIIVFFHTKTFRNILDRFYSFKNIKAP